MMNLFNMKVVMAMDMVMMMKLRKVDLQIRI